MATKLINRRSAGIRDFDRYSCVPGSKDLAVDFFLDESFDQMDNLNSRL